MDSERRRQKRRRFTYYMQVVDAATLKPVGYLADISTTGLRLDSEKPLPVNASYELRMDLTPEIANKSFLILSGRSRWCQMDKLAPNSYNVGFEVGAISRDDSLIFQRMFENYATESRW